MVCHWNFASKILLWHQKQTCISLLQLAGAHCPMLTKRWKESQALSSLLFYLSWRFELRKNENKNIPTHLYFFCPWVEFIYQTFPKVSQQNCHLSNNILQQKKMSDNLFLFDSICMFNNWMKIRENRGMWTVWAAAVVLTNPKVILFSPLNISSLWHLCNFVNKIHQKTLDLGPRGFINVLNRKQLVFTGACICKAFRTELLSEKLSHSVIWWPKAAA